MSFFKRLFQTNAEQPLSLELAATRERRALFLRYINRGWLAFGIVTLVTLPLFPDDRPVFLFLIVIIFPTYLLIRFLNLSGRTSLAGILFTVIVDLGFYSLFLMLVQQMGAYQAFETQSTIWMLMGLAVLFGGSFIDKSAAFVVAFLNSVLLIGTRLTLAPNADARPSVLVFWWMLALTIYLYERILAQAFMRILTELSERRRAEKDREANRILAGELYELTPDALVTINAEGRITSVNAQVLTIFGYSREQLIDHPIEMLIPQRYHSKHEKERKAYFKKPHLRPMGKGLDLFGVRRDGTEFPVEISLSPIHLGEETLVTAAIRDVTERKSAEEEREALIGELEIKNAELERFIYTASHDLKSPIVTIRGFLGYLEEDLKSGNMQRLAADIDRINTATNKMRTLLDDLLDISRIGRLVNPSETISFNEIVRQAQESTASRLKERNIQLKVQTDLPSVEGDRVRLVEVMQNLIDNAAKFTGDQPSPVIEVGAEEKDRRYVFFVKDNGMGISPEYHERIFNLFDKLDPMSEGTGIGLAIVKRIIELHNGRIWVESENGQGSIFYFTLGKVGQNNPVVDH